MLSKAVVWVKKFELLLKLGDGTDGSKYEMERSLAE